MISIGLLSDTHGLFDKKFAQYFAQCNEIWHAGDIGNVGVLDSLQAINPAIELRAVYGNCDGQDVRRRCSENIIFRVEDVDVLLTHIGGYPGHYESRMLPLFREYRPRIFACGHSHILKIMNDRERGMLCINPGAAGLSGFHRVRTLLRFKIDGADIRDMEIIEIGENTMRM
jgi:putative phosphoesterase